MMNHHNATIHKGKKQFKCEICNTNAGQKRELKTHVATLHEER